MTLTAPAQNRNALPLLVDEGLLQDGDTLVLCDWALRREVRGQWDPAQFMFQVVVDKPARKVRWRPDSTTPERLISAGSVADAIHRSLLGCTHAAGEVTPTGSCFTKGPRGPLLSHLARGAGLWI